MTKAVEQTRPYTNEELERLKRDVRRGQSHASISMLFATIEAYREKLEESEQVSGQALEAAHAFEKRAEAAEARVRELEKEREMDRERGLLGYDKMRKLSAQLPTPPEEEAK